MVTPIIPPSYATVAQFAQLHAVSERTVKRWLAGDHLPGATKSEAGHWLIPDHLDRPNLDAVTGGEVILAPSYAVATQPSPQALATQAQATPAPALSEPVSGRTFYSAEEASELLSCPEFRVSPYSIRKNREYYHAIVGDHGRIGVPIYRIMQLKGMVRG